jgi:hypothetical protein
VNTWVALEPLSATVEAGGEAVVWLRVRNTADVVEEYHIDVVGDPALWCAIEPTTLRLYPGTTGSVRLTFASPRSPDAAAGPHPYGVRVRPVENPDAVSVPEGNLSVIPFTDIHAELLPVTVRGWRHAKPRLVVDNYGNTTVTAAVIATAPGNRVDFDIRTPSFQVPPGRGYFSVLTLRPERLLWLGRPVSHPFTTTVQPSGSESATVQGTYIQSALLPTWMARLGMVLFGLAAAFVALWLLAKPSVSSDATADVATAPAVTADPQVQTSSPAPVASHGRPAATHGAPAGHPAPAADNPAPAAGNPAPAAADNPPRQSAGHKPSTVSLPKPAGYWTLDAASSSTAADSAGHHPAVGSNTSWCPTRNCALFDGANSDFVTRGPVLNTGPGKSFTVAAWIWLYSVPSSGFATFVSQDAATNSGFYLQFAGPNHNGWAFSRVSSDSANPPHSYRAVSNGPAGIRQWTYLTGVYNGATNRMRLYVDGVLQADTVTDPTPYAARGDFAIGRAQYNGHGTDWVLGDESHVEAFNTALSSAQVKLLMSRS